MNEIKLYKSPWKAIRLLLLCLPFVVLGVLDLSYHNFESDWVSWCCICFFGLGIPFGIFNLFDKRPQIIINETGIFDRSAYKDFINWDIIDHAYWNTSYKQAFVCLIIKDEFKHLIEGNEKLRKLSKAMGYEEINIDLGPVSNIDHEKLTGLIVNLASAKPSDRGLLINKTLHRSPDQKQI
ncbi:STM3941 family protein [Mucilaginibacter polytrichastri]|uniref:Uncharacterized protein n=1 Tax=Mucilaginibacter polytrichastri TaxID=1302689 RepID=A0A1Q5ZZE1_9SPHI|nr:STM3941 family protein [Mucilaginibacter polytrichastri]OKS87121.1 hypothetical protein RG47T_2580 [Mucilaginibacter polytrichastri]SFS87765.1 hypothetical protein SAMN04487890_105190 [Mucilaginibacter polytrichastri]